MIDRGFLHRRLLVAQVGAREHYAVARALHQQGMLVGLVTDWYAYGESQSRERKTESRKRRAERGKGKEERGEDLTINIQHSRSNFPRFAVRCLSSVIRSPSARAARAEGIPDELVHCFPLRSLFWKWRVRQRAKQGRLYEGYASTDAAFAAAVARLQLPTHDAFFGYSYASLEMLKAEKKRGVLTVLDQIDPGAVEFRIVAEEMRRHPEIAGPPAEFPAANFDRNRREWELANVILVNSEWSREAIVKEGADPAKIEILPLAYEANEEKQKAKSRNEKIEGNFFFQVSDSSVSAFSPLRVLWLGQVNMRKGIHYLMQAARLLKREQVQFDVVGPIGILPGAVATAPRNMTFHGPVSRDRAAEWYRQSDVFVLPTLSDGFALTQLEAMAHGLPVIATPKCGRVVEDGKTGFIVPPCDSHALADAIFRFVRNSNLATEMSPVCRKTVSAYSLETYGQSLIAIVNKHKEKRR